MSRHSLAAIACICASMLPACTSTGSDEREALLLEFRPEVGAVHRFRRAMDLEGGIAPAKAPEGAAKFSITSRVSFEVTCRVVDRTPPGNTILEATVDGLTFTFEGPGGKFEADSRRPETWKNLPGDHPFGMRERDLETIRRLRLRFEVAPDGAAVAQQGFEASEDGRSLNPCKLPDSLPGVVWPFGALPCGNLLGRPEEGARTDFTMTLPFGPPGGPSIQDFRGRGSWTTAAWNPGAGEAILHVEGEFPGAVGDSRGQSRSATGTVTGDAVWSSSLGVVRHSLTLWKVTVREARPASPEIQVTARFEETLLD